MTIYSIRDINVGFNQPFCDSSDATAVRGFAFACNSNDMIGFRPGDFDLYSLGSFDPESGMITPTIPQLVKHATEVINDQ